MLSLEYLRSFKLWDYAIFDLSLAFIAVILLSPILSKIFRHLHLEIPRLSWILFTLPLSLIFHILTDNFTLMTRQFLSLEAHYFLKFLILFLTVVGVSKIKVIQ